MVAPVRFEGVIEAVRISNLAVGRMRSAGDVILSVVNAGRGDQEENKNHAAANERKPASIA